MTLKELKQYQSICAELRELEVEIHKSKVGDTVSGSDPEFPYTKHTILISGVSKADNSFLEKKHQLEKRKQQIEFFINGISDLNTMRIFRKRFINGKSWRKIAYEMGGGNTEDSVRKICERYIIKYCKN